MLQSLLKCWNRVLCCIVMKKECYVEQSFDEYMLFQLQFPPQKFIETLKLMEHRYGAKDYVTSKDSSLLAPGTFYLTEVDTMYRRFYTTKSSESNLTPAVNGLSVNGH